MSATPCAVRLQEARDALHRLLTGKKSVQVRHGDQMVEFRNFASDIEQLRVYIRELEAECGGTNGNPVRRQPLGVNW